MSELVFIQAYSNRLEAEQAQRYLQGQGIDAMVMADDGEEIGSIAWSPGAGKIAFVRGGPRNAAGELPNAFGFATGVERALQAVVVADFGDRLELLLVLAHGAREQAGQKLGVGRPDGDPVGCGGGVSRILLS